MESKTYTWPNLPENIDTNVSLVFCGMNRMSTDQELLVKTLNEKFPNAKSIIFSTSGHFVDNIINENTPVISAISFDSSKIHVVIEDIADYESSEVLGEKIGEQFKNIPNLKGISIISDGGLINGTELLNGINKSTPEEIHVFGGMAGDDTRFEKTLVGLNSLPAPGKIIAVGYSGEKLTISTGSNGGWKTMGLQFKITKSDKNILYELDNKNAYDILYNLLEPANDAEFNTNTLYYPFLLDQENQEGVIRTPIAVDHENKKIVYAGNMPEGTTVKLMKSSTMELLDAVLDAANTCIVKPNSFVFATSCVGRRVVLDEFANDEYKELLSVFGPTSSYFGFYSYGEFAGHGKGKGYASLHNQTFTLAAISEE